MSHHCTDIALGGKSNSGYYDYHHFKTRKNQTTKLGVYHLCISAFHNFKNCF